MLFKTARNIISEVQQWSKEEALRNRARLVVDSGSYIMFFRNKGRIFGSNETSRVTFAKFLDKTDGDNDDPGWRNNAYFTAHDLLDQGLGKQTTAIFGKDDISSIEVIKDTSSLKEELFELMKSETK